MFAQDYVQVLYFGPNVYFSLTTLFQSYSFSNYSSKHLLRHNCSLLTQVSNQLIARQYI